MQQVNPYAYLLKIYDRDSPNCYPVQDPAPGVVHLEPHVCTVSLSQ